MFGRKKKPIELSRSAMLAAMERASAEAQRLELQRQLRRALPPHLTATVTRIDGARVTVADSEWPQIEDVHGRPVVWVD